jgi:hypothetical protein
MPLVRKPTGSPSSPEPAADLPTIEAALARGDDDERWAAARSAARLPGVERILGAALAREANPRVREALFTSLARLATTASVEAALPFLRADRAQIRTEAAGALMSMKEAAAPYFAVLLNDVDADVRILACDLVRGLPSETASRLFCSLLETEREPNVCAAAVDALAEVGDASALPVLARCAERFRDTAFLVFSIRIVTDRIGQQSRPPRA